MENGREQKATCYSWGSSSRKGSLLGIYLNHIGNSFPVGKVNHLFMYPLTFTEFLKTKDPNMYEYLCSIKEITPLPQIFFDKLRESFVAYSICGGMPEPATLMIDFNDMEKVDSALRDILNEFYKTYYAGIGFPH